jgi:hypothetical protein
MENLPYKKVCIECDIHFRAKGRNKKFCTRECKIKYNEKFYTYTNCKICNVKFRTFPTKNEKFCNNKCKGEYYKFNKIHPPEHMIKMQKARTEETWKKGVETRKANGNIISWDVAEWKQYWRRCNDLTRKIRAELLRDWDGFDYIDGENIRENLALPYTHADYPTLDHIIPRSEGFRQGLSPYEITTPENLKWTKRKNNSKKYNKV